MCALQSRYLQLLAHTHTPADTHHLLPVQTRRLRGFRVRGTIPSLMKLHAYSHPGTNTFAYKILPPQAPNLDPLLCVCRCLEAKMTPSLRVSREFHPKSWQHLLPFPLRAVLIAFPGVPLPLADEEEACQVCWCGEKKLRCRQLPGSVSPISWSAQVRNRKGSPHLQRDGWAGGPIRIMCWWGFPELWSPRVCDWLCVLWVYG